MVRLVQAPSIENTLTRFGMVWSWRVAVCLIAVVLLNAGCTTLQPSQLPPDAIRAGIRDGYLVKVGDQIGVVTKDGAEQVVRVLGVEAEAIRGETSADEEVVIAIDDVLALRTPQLDSLSGADVYTQVAFGARSGSDTQRPATDA